MISVEASHFECLILIRNLRIVEGLRWPRVRGADLISKVSLPVFNQSQCGNQREYEKSTRHFVQLNS
jgi:hypothetical protein